MSLMGTTFKAGLVTMTSGSDLDANTVAACRLIREIAAEGASYVQTPENTGLMAPDRARLQALAEPEDRHRILAALVSLAKELRIWLHIGSLAVRRPDGKLANRGYLVAPDGQVRARYDKIHMFDVNLPNGESFRESERFEAGSEAVVADLPWGRLGITICYDLRFPQLYRTLAQGGAGILTVPSAFTQQTGEAHWHTLLRARAIETGSFVLAAAQAGRHDSGRMTYGHSLAVSPWGDVIAEGGVEPGVVLAEIDLAHVASARARIPALVHDRPFTIATPSAESLKAAS
ncbi:MAG: carbon-nitrogen hydrolase family protein [Hyphomicrobiaceae bacterium]